MPCLPSVGYFAVFLYMPFIKQFRKNKKKDYVLLPQNESGYFKLVLLKLQSCRILVSSILKFPRHLWSHFRYYGLSALFL